MRVLVLARLTAEVLLEKVIELFELVLGEAVWLRLFVGVCLLVLVLLLLLLLFF